MPVTELALLSIKTSATSDSTLIPQALLDNLHYAASEQAKYSGCPVTLLQCIEDPSNIYLVGGWEGVDTHMKDWIPGRTNQELLGLLGEAIDVKWMFHVDCEPGLVSVLLQRGGGVDGVTALQRRLVKGGMEGREEFSRRWRGVRNVLGKYALMENDRVLGGWRVDVGFESEKGNQVDRDFGEGTSEFVLFTTWSSVQSHEDFVKTKNFRRDGEILDSAETRHAKTFHVSGL